MKFKFLEIDYGEMNTIIGLKWSHDRSVHWVAREILGCVSQNDIDRLNESIDPIEFLKDNFPKKLKSMKNNIELYTNLNDYNRAFTLYGRQHVELFEKPFDFIKDLLDKSNDPLKTMNDEYWPNPHSVLLHEPSIDREVFLKGHNPRTLTAFRNYLITEDIICLDVVPNEYIHKLAIELIKLKVIKPYGSYFLPKKFKHVKQLTKFPSLHTTFNELLPKKNTFNETLPVIVELDLLINDKSTVHVFLYQAFKEKMIYNSNYCNKVLCEKNNLKRVIFIFDSYQSFLLASKTEHYNFSNISRLQFVAHSINKVCKNKLLFNSYINN